ncbi:hypothetical protein [Fructobacillus cardui]|uniref:hypothetical protein n=1 Tax=Fructobacillus cardui TaxID=2893170 RepID=UPI00200A8A14|nr:hypothetical protein [Fructobacillus cardui]MCK8627293.1 hypothetical protein [Fructobacillus cardui]
MNSKEQRAHELALMMAKVFTEASFEAAKLSNVHQVDIDGSKSLNVYLDVYKEALKRME